MTTAISDRQFFLLRLGKTTLRALHVLGIVGAASGFFHPTVQTHWQPWWILAMSSGLLLMLWEIWRSPLWLVQLKGLGSALKIGLLALCYPYPHYGAALFGLIAVWSVYLAHGPSQFRHYSVWHRRVLRGKEIKG